MANNDTSPITPGATAYTSERSPQEIERYRRVIYNTCLGLCFVCPAVMLLPPRRIDLYTFGLGITWFTCAGYVTEQKTGQGLLWHIGNQLPGARHRERTEELKREEDEKMILAKQRDNVVEALGIGTGRTADTRDSRGLLQRVWMGGESDDWVEERKKKEQEALDEGRGYGSLIWEQVKEVWGAEKEVLEDASTYQTSGAADSAAKTVGRATGTTDRAIGPPVISKDRK